MRCVIPEVAYHNRDPVLSIDFQVYPDPVLRFISVANPGSGAFLILESGIRYGYKSGSGSGMNNPDHISESLETISFVNCLNSLMRIRDPGWQKFRSGMEKFGSGILEKHPGSASLHFI
jgi:hypothetical protein